MRLISCRQGSRTGVAVWNREKKAYFDLSEKFSDFSQLLAELSAQSTEELALLEKKFLADAGDPLPSETIEFLPPTVLRPKILCIGLNYADHAKEFNDPIPGEPVVFCKAGSTLNCHGGAICVPKESDRIDYEAELVLVIGRGGRNIPAARALDHIVGYSCGNDVSCRDWQKNKPAGQWFLGKSFDTFAPLGPALVTRDEIPNPNALDIQSRLNSRVMQSSNTSNFIFPVEELVAYLSRVMTLETGDLIFTGTPGGVGERRVPPVFLRAGDRMEVEIENVGTLVNRVIDE